MSKATVCRRRFALTLGGYTASISYQTHFFESYALLGLRFDIDLLSSLKSFFFNWQFSENGAQPSCIVFCRRWFRHVFRSTLSERLAGDAWLITVFDVVIFSTILRQVSVITIYLPAFI